MDLDAMLRGLYGKDTKNAYANLLWLEELSERENTLYPYLGEFIALLGSDKYVERVRGFRLLCKQARWDADDKIDAEIGTILAALQDEKPTAVRQKLQYLGEVAQHKPALCGNIKVAVLAVDYSGFEDTMRPLIEKDIQSLVRRIDQSVQA